MNTDIFKNKKLMPPLALLCAILWALAYPFIKLGYSELGISSDDLSNKILFAGVRFLFAGIIVLLITNSKKKLNVKEIFNFKIFNWILLFALVNTSLHYLFSYVGLGYIKSSRGTILDSTGCFFLIIFSCIVFSDDKMSIPKAIGCLVGFSGILLINLEPGNALFENITFLGDGMILLNALCAAFGGLISRVVSRKIDMTVATGMSMAVGGGILCIVGIIAHPYRLWNLTLPGFFLLLALILISAISFSIYNSLLANHPISKVAIFNAFIPVFGVCFSSIILGEAFNWKYLVAGIMTTIGTYLANLETKK